MDQTVLTSRISSSKDVVPPAVLETLRKLHAAGHEAFLAGGCVRDLILGRAPDDYDVATSARPEEVIKLFRHVVPTGIQHGTVTVVLGHHPTEKVEVTTYRGEGEYLDGRRPESVEFITDLDQDLARRDFTINAMALDPTTVTLRDPFKGLDDLDRSIVRAVGDATARFSEDGLRPLRAVRFASVLGFQLEPETHRAIPAAIQTFRRVAQERIRDELNKLLMRSPAPSAGLKLLEETRLLVEILPEVEPVGTQTMRLVDLLPPRPPLRWAAVLQERVSPQKAGEVLERLKHPKKLIESVAHLVREQAWRYEPGATDADVRRHLARIGLDQLEDVLAFREAKARSTAPTDEAAIAAEAEFRRRALAEADRQPPLRIQELALSGNDVMRLAGTGPGAYVGTTLRALLDHVLEHPEDNTRELLEPIARERIALSRPR